MSPENYKKHFLAGFTKRAEEYGFEKSAILGTIAGTSLRILAPIFGQHYLTKGLGAIGKRKGFGTAKKLHKLLTQSPMVSTNLGDNLKGQAAFMGTSLMADKMLNPIVEPIAGRFEQRDIPKEYRNNL